MNIPRIEKCISEETKSSLVQLGLYQLIGGLIGGQLILWLLFNTPPITNHSVTVKLVMFSFYVYSIFCGILCFKSSALALRHMQINQFLQLFGFVGLGYTYRYIAGVYISVGFDFTHAMQFVFDVGISKFHFYREPGIVEFDVNLVALALILWSEKLRRKIKWEVSNFVEVKPRSRTRESEPAAVS